MAGKHKFQAILFFGCPGSGKGTQGVVLGQMPNLVHLAMGDIFRALDKASDIGKEFLSYSTKGSLVPDELTIRVFQHHVEGMVAAKKVVPEYHTLILDGIPRTQSQVTLLKDFIDVRCVIHLNMKDRDALIKRLASRASKSNRPDDADRSVIERRIRVYEEETFPVLEMYPKSKILDINADQAPLAVLRDIAQNLLPFVSSEI